MAIRIRNGSKTPLLITEYHDIVCRARNECKCSSGIVLNSHGKPTVARAERTFQIGVRELSEPVDDAVKLVPQVQTGLRLGLVKIFPVTAEE